MGGRGQSRADAARRAAAGRVATAAEVLRADPDVLADLQRAAEVRAALAALLEVAADPRRAGTIGVHLWDRIAGLADRITMPSPTDPRPAVRPLPSGYHNGQPPDPRISRSEPDQARRTEP